MSFENSILPSVEEKDLIDKYINEDVRKLALKLKNDRNVRIQYVLQQIAGYQIIKKKIPFFSDIKDLIYPVHLSLEQCSSATTAKYKSDLLSKLIETFDLFIDLTGGFGVDFSYIASVFSKSVYVEQNEELCRIVEHNLPLLGLDNFRIICGDGINVLNQNDLLYNLIYLDPARRDKNGGKTVHISDCTPNLVEYEDLLVSKAEYVVVKLSPMLDISEAIAVLKYVHEIHIVSVDNECKELLLVLKKNYSEDKRIFTCNINNSGLQLFDFIRLEEENCELLIASEIKKYIYEPNASIMKAGAFKSISNKYGVRKLNVNSHLYTSDVLITEFPGRVFEVLSIGSLGKNTLPVTLNGIKKANVAVRNYPLKPDDIKSKIKIKDGGSDYIFATTAHDGKRIVIHCIIPSSLARS